MRVFPVSDSNFKQPIHTVIANASEAIQPVARMSESDMQDLGQEPGCRFAHPGYGHSSQ
jgi:hypothetical protein